MTTRRQFMQTLPAAGTAFAVAGHMLLDENTSIAAPVVKADGHFHPKGKAPSEHTLEFLTKAKATLPF